MLGGVLIQQVLEVGGAGAQDHLVGFGMLALEDLIKGMSSEAPRPLIQGLSKVRSISIK